MDYLGRERQSIKGRFGEEEFFYKLAKKKDSIKREFDIVNEIEMLKGSEKYFVRLGKKDEVREILNKKDSPFYYVIFENGVCDLGQYMKFNRDY